MERVALYCSAYPDKIITESLLLKLSPERRTVIAPAPVTDLPPEPVNTATATEAVARFRGIAVLPPTGWGSAVPLYGAV